MTTYFRRAISRFDEVLAEHADTFSLILVTVGSIMVAVAVDFMPLPTDPSVKIAYLANESWLQLGLIAIVVGFGEQLFTNLSGKRKFKNITVARISLAAVLSLLILVLA